MPDLRHPRFTCEATRTWGWVRLGPHLFDGCSLCGRGGGGHACQGTACDRCGPLVTFLDNLEQDGGNHQKYTAIVPRPISSDFLRCISREFAATRCIVSLPSLWIQTFENGGFVWRSPRSVLFEKLESDELTHEGFLASLICGDN